MESMLPQWNLIFLRLIFPLIFPMKRRNRLCTSRLPLNGIRKEKGLLLIFPRMTGMF